jgi:isopentenyldiphosphate isomerase
MRVVILWLISEKGELLLSRRSRYKSSDAGVWGPTISGKIEEIESDIAAAIREAHEELGVLPKDITPLFLHAAVHNHQDGEIREFRVYYAKVAHTIVKSLRPEPTEVAEIKWISFNDLQALAKNKSKELIISSDTELWKIVFNNLNRVIN